MAMTNYPDHYSGVCVSARTNTVYVMRVPGSDLDANVTRMATGWPLLKVTFADVQASENQLRALVDRIKADTTEWQAKGVAINGLTIAPNGAGVVVETPQWQTAEADIKARYGPLVAEVR
ncbi:hypothetical protein ACIQOW_17280 [Kitasatospora sp. NPDC091335]|uniref:hypothetical protein n=1 Tax=Kitasatospora sp. NPDC091335 TaxID=3364085 RepID=UPI0037FF04A9